MARFYQLRILSAVAFPAMGLLARGSIAKRTRSIPMASHFALAHFLGERAGQKLFLKNGDRASQTTSRQQAEVQELCSGPTVSFTAFSAAGVDLSALRVENVIDFAEDKRVYLTREKETGTFYRLGKWNAELGEYERGEVFTPPKQGAFFPDRSEPEKNGFVSGVWHVVAACLIHVNGRYLLSAVDEGSYFVSELSSPAKSIEEAFALLKPREVRKAEAKGATVLRQGEWYFVPTGIRTDRDLARSLNLPRLGDVKIDSLPRPKDSNRPRARQLPSLLHFRARRRLVGARDSSASARNGSFRSRDATVSRGTATTAS